MTLSPLRPDTGIATQSSMPMLPANSAIIGADRVEHRLVVIDQVHLVHRQHEAADADQMRQIAVAPGLGQHALARIDQQHGEVGGRGAGDHVAGILLVARRVGDDELALGAREEAVGDVDRDALLALGRKPVDQQREIDLLALRADALAVGLERRQLVVEDLLAVVEQPPDQGRLAVVDAAAGDEAQQLLRLLLREPGAHVAGGSVRGRGRAGGPSEIALLLLLLHDGAAGVAVDRAALPLARSWSAAFPATISSTRRRLALDRARQRIAAERAEADRAHRPAARRSSGKRSSSTIRIRPSRSTVGRSAAK